MLERFERGDITPEEWRGSACCAAPTGSGRTPMRRCCASRFRRACSTRAQLEALADVAERYSRGFGHISTRQNMQFHFVKLHDAEPAMRRLAEAGMTTREACGNSVRNITGMPICRGRARRGLRRHAVRGSDDALPAAPSAQLGAAAQVQDRVRGLRLRGSRGDVDQRSRVARGAGPGRVGRADSASAWRAAPRSCAARGASLRVPARVRHPRMLPKPCCASSSVTVTTSTSSATG